MENRTEWVMHVWGKKRDKLELTDVEKFHIDMLKMFQDQHKRFDRIIVNFAMDDIQDLNLYHFLKSKIQKVIKNKNVEFWACQNEKDKGDYVTFRPYVFDRIGKDVNVLYTHFRGYHSYLKVGRESYPMRVTDINEMFWSYIMYRYLLDIDDVQEKLKDKAMYSWYLLKGNEDGMGIGYCKEYFKTLYAGDSRFVGLESDDLNKHSPGSFNWYNLKNLGSALASKPFVTSVTTDYLLNQRTDSGTCMCPHFSELYLPKFLDEKDCYSVKDYNEEMKRMPGTLYTAIYAGKLIAREYLKDFEKYLIENELL